MAVRLRYLFRAAASSGSSFSKIRLPTSSTNIFPNKKTLTAISLNPMEPSFTCNSWCLSQLCTKTRAVDEFKNNSDTHEDCPKCPEHDSLEDVEEDDFDLYENNYHFQNDARYFAEAEGEEKFVGEENVALGSSDIELCHEDVDVQGGGGFGIEQLLTMQEIMKVLHDVKAQDIKSIDVREQSEWTEFMVLASGRSGWHVQNIAQALIYKLKQKQKGSRKMLLPTVEGREGGKWLLLDVGKIIIHILDENARSYYDLESLWTKERCSQGKNQKYELEKSLEKILPKRAKNFVPQH